MKFSKISFLNEVVQIAKTKLVDSFEQPVGTSSCSYPPYGHGDHNE